MQSNDQRAYDRGHTIFSPDGRLYQVEYAREAVKRGSPTVGVRTGDAVVLATDRRRRSRLIEPDSIEKLHDIDGRIGMGTAGHVADGRRLVDAGQTYAQRDRLRYGERPGVEPVAKAIADHIQESTQSGGTRPFGASLLVAGGGGDRPRLFEVEPSGTPYEWRATAIGAGSGEIRESLEERYERGLDTQRGVDLALQALAGQTEPTATTVDIAILGPDGFDQFDRDRRERAIESAGVAGP